MTDDNRRDTFVDLQKTLTARAHELNGAERSFQRLIVLNDIMREVGEKHFSLPSHGPFEVIREAWTAEDELRDARQWLRDARPAPFLHSWQSAVPHWHCLPNGRKPPTSQGNA